MIEDAIISNQTPTPASHPSAGSVILFAFWVGVATGFVEVAYFLKQAFLRHVFVWLGKQSLWMTPLAEGLLFVFAALILLAVFQLIERLRTWEVVVGTFIALSLLSLLTLYDRMQLHIVANLLLAAGVGSIAGRVVAPRISTVRRIVARTMPVMFALGLALAAGLNLALYLRERSVLAALRDPLPNSPNVVLIVLDTVRAMNLSLYGYSRETTPHLDRFARRGLRFERAIAPSSWTLPTHASLFTGHSLQTHRADWRVPLDDELPTLAEFLSGLGYRTAGFVANKRYTSWETGLDRGFSHYEDYEVSLGELIASSTLGEALATDPFVRRYVIRSDQLLGRKSAATINRDFQKWLSVESDRPFFAFLNYLDAHVPYLPPAPYDYMFKEGGTRGRISELTRHNAPTAEMLRAEINSYDGAIAYLDQELGSLFMELEKRGLLEDTLVIVTSDHGEEFAEHGATEHGNTLYMPSLHVPLVMVFPARLPAGLSVSGPVGLEEIPATIVSLIGRTDDSPFDAPPLPTSISVLDEAISTDAPAILSELSYDPWLPKGTPISLGDMVSLVVDSLHYIRNGDGREELFDFERDPLEQKNLISEADPAMMRLFRQEIVLRFP